jgi:hypothetical protein
VSPCEIDLLQASSWLLISASAAKTLNENNPPKVIKLMNIKREYMRSPEIFLIINCVDMTVVEKTSLAEQI